MRGGMIDNVDLIIRLSHELSVAMTMLVEPVEMQEIWVEAIDAIRDAKAYLVEQQLSVPEELDTCLRLAEATD